MELSLTQSPSLCLYLESLLLASVLILLVLLQQNTPTIIVGVDIMKVVYYVYVDSLKYRSLKMNFA